MLRALWFFFQLAIVAAAAIWISSQSGAVDVSWNDYTMSAHLGIFLLALAALFLIGFALFRLIGWLVSAPEKYARMQKERNRTKAFRALTRGFVAIAAGDGKRASSHARDVRKLMPDETGLPVLLEAQAARLRGEEDTARRAFETLLTDEDAAFFGVKGLLKSSIETGDKVSALTFAKNALEKNPKQPWVLKTVYDLELENHQWHAAMALLPRVRKLGAIDEARARRDEIALLLILADEDRVARDGQGELKKIERAVKLDPAFAPSVMRLADYYIAQGKNGKAISVLERAWKSGPHRDLESLWERLAPEPSPTDPFRRLRWFERLATLNDTNIDGKLAAAKAAMDAGLNGEARSYLQAAETIRPTARSYRLRAELEEHTSRNATLVREWLDQALAAEAEPVWYCTLTGDLYDHWSPVAQPHGSFNTIQWGHPSPHHRRVIGGADASRDPMMIEKN